MLQTKSQILLLYLILLSNLDHLKSNLVNSISTQGMEIQCQP